MAKNIKFSYLYRDGGNYKNFDFLIFANPTEIDVSELYLLIRSKLIDQTWFYANEWKLPDLKTSYFDFKIDPTWHEFESVEYTDEAVNANVDLEELIDAIQKTNII